MRPLFLHVFSTLMVGGAQVRTADLATAFGERVKHLFFAADGNREALQRLRFDAPFEALEGSFAKSRGIAFANLRCVRGLLHERRPSLLLTYNFGSLEAALANRFSPLAPHVHFEDGFGADESPTRQHARRVWLRRLALSGPSTLVVPSQTLKRLALERWRFPASKIVYIPNGIDLQRCSTAVPISRVDLGVPDDAVLVGAIGALRPEKNLPRLLRCMRAAYGAGAHLHLVIVGDGSEREKLQALSVELGLAGKVTFTGHVTRPEAIVAALDIVALSSDTEQMPYSVVEAMAAAKPVVATAVGDVPSMLAETAEPWTTALADEAAFARNLQVLADDPILRTEIGRQNRRRAESAFAIDAMVEHYRELFNGKIQDGRSIPAV